MPGHSEEKAVKEVRRRIQKDMGKKAPLFVPRPCIFELGNRIAQVNDGGMRHKLVKSLLDMVEKHNPLTITPMVEREPLSKISTPFIDKELLPSLCNKFFEEYVEQGVGLTDAFVIEEARRFNRKYSDLHQVHIWTKDSSLKAYEPDHEKNPFLG